MFRSKSPLITDIKQKYSNSKSRSRSTSPLPSNLLQNSSNSQSNSNISFHDIRLHSTYKNTIIIKGSPNESDPLSLSGHVVFSLLEKTNVSSISLNLIGNYNIHFVENFQTSNGKILTTCPFIENDCIINCNWNNLLTSSNGNIVYSNILKNTNTNKNKNKNNTNINNTINNNKCFLQNNFNNLQIFKYTSTIPFGETPFNKLSNDNNTIFELPPGNYSLPFKIILPGNIPETFESMKSVSIVYHLESKINTLNSNPSFNNIYENSNIFNTFKYFRIIRTLSSLQLALNEEFLAENSWARKLQYKIRIPRKIIPIGSTLKIYMLIIPIMKKLKLGKITIQIAQFLKFNSLKPNDFGENSFTDEKIIYQHSLPLIPYSQLPQDVWALEAKIPTSNLLKHCSPDFETKSELISVKHKLIIFINLINPDGHISQVKSKIPLGFYIKPNTKIYGKNITIDKETGNVKFIPGNDLIFDVDFDDENEENKLRIPELLVNSCDLLNPDSFLFNDNSNNEENTQSFSPLTSSFLLPSSSSSSSVKTTTPHPSSNNLNTIIQICENPNNCNLINEIPPTYEDSLNDTIFEPNQISESASPICGSPPLLNSSNFDNNLNLRSRSNSNFSRTIKIDEKLPSYKKIFDDDTSDIGEPTPLYDEIDNSNSSLRSILSNSNLKHSNSSTLLKNSMENRYLDSSLNKRFQNQHVINKANLTSSLTRPSSPLLSLSSSTSSIASMSRYTNNNNNNNSNNNNNNNYNDDNSRVSVKRTLSSSLLNNQHMTLREHERIFTGNSNNNENYQISDNEDFKLPNNKENNLKNKCTKRKSNENGNIHSRIDKTSNKPSYFSTNNSILSSSSSDLDLIGV